MRLRAAELSTVPEFGGRQFIEQPVRIEARQLARQLARTARPFAAQANPRAGYRPEAEPFASDADIQVS